MPRFLVSALAAAAIHLVILLAYPHWEPTPMVLPHPDTAITIAISHIQPPMKKIDPKPVPKPLPVPPKKEPLPKIQKPKPVPDIPEKKLEIPVPPEPEVLKEPEIPSVPKPEPEPKPEPAPAHDPLPEAEPEILSPPPPAPALKPAAVRKTAVPLYKENPLPRYPRSARQRGYTGTVYLMVLVDVEGGVENLWIFESSGYKSLDEEALQTVKHWLFEPGTVDGTPEGMWVKVPVTFKIKK